MPDPVIPPVTTDAKATKSKVKPAYALHRINGVVEPGDTFVPLTDKDREELVSFEAVRDLTEAEQSLFEKVGPSKNLALPNADVLG